MVLDSIRLGNQAKDQLVRLKRITGIENWNVLCRWAFCISIADKHLPPKLKNSGDAAVEMSWKTFAGEYSDVYIALLLQRAHEENRGTSKEVLSELVRAHIIRGIGNLTARRQMEGIGDLLGAGFKS